MILHTIKPDGVIALIGCGGTGAFVADGLCRLLIGKAYRLILVDHDRVEEHNLGRQAFYVDDLGRFKSETLALRLARNYGREVGYDTHPASQNIQADLVIGCVDNPEARRVLANLPQYSRYYTWYLDAGNSRDSGQVLIGNRNISELKGSFANNICTGLPLPSIQQPALLIPETRPPLDCAEAVAANEQSPVINHVMAGLVLQFVHLLLEGRLGWMSAYINLELGTLRTVDAEPEAVARLIGKKVTWLQNP
jgi:PRTRC genetic system ThiF family protein